MNAWELVEEDRAATIVLASIERDATTALEARLRLEASQRGLTFAQVVRRYIAETLS